MSLESISLRPFIPSSAPAPTIMVGVDEIAHSLSRAILQYGSNTPVEKDPLVVVEQNGRRNPFGRDKGIVGLNHIYLIPNAIHFDILTEAEYRAHLPTSSSHFLNNPKCNGLGRGFSSKYAMQMHSYMQQHHLPHYPMLSTVEGGNCYVFFDSQGNPKAIVGLNSVALTLVGLERLEFFKKPEIQNYLREYGFSPDEEDIRHARNMNFFVRLKNYYEFCEHVEENRSGMSDIQIERNRSALDHEYTNFVSEYQNFLLKPVSAEDNMRFADEARIWKAKESLAREVIANDLAVPVENVAFVTQADFHIDMDMFVDPNGEKVYLDKGATNPSIREALDRIGCQVILVSGVHTVGNDSINFMNGVIVSTPSGPLFVTNGVKDNGESIRIRNLFCRTIEMANPNLQIHFLDETQMFVTRAQGGVRCLTWKRPNNVTPLDIVFSYVDEGTPVQRIRTAAGEAVASLDTPLGMGKAILGKSLDSDAHASSS